MPFVLGSLVGLALGLVGGGGSIITVPLLVGPLGVSPHAATTMSLVIVGVTAATASVAHARRGNVMWNRAIPFAILGIVGTTTGGYLNRAVPARLLLAGFVALMVVAAIGTWRRAGSRDQARRPLVAPASRTGERTSFRARARRLLPESCPLVDVGPFVATAVGVGLVTGFFGVGGGFLIVPALVIVMRLPMPAAIGTSLPIIAMNSATALAGHLGTSVSIDPTITLLFTSGAVVAGLIGGAISTRLPAAGLGRGFALIVLSLAAYLSLQVI